MASKKHDPRALFVWLTDHADAQSVVAGPLRMSGGLTLSSDEIAIDALRAELDRMTVAGRFGYRWASEGRPPREAPWPVLAQGKVRHVGEPVALCVADTKAAAEEMTLALAAS